jgi:hypothetical protein
MRLALPAIAVAAFGASALMAAPGDTTFTITLTGAAEVPGPGDPDGTGTATITLMPATRQICYELEVSGIDTATAAHIHAGSAGIAGGVVVPLDPPADGTSANCVTVKASLISRMERRPQLYYVNVHNAAYPAGALRGQLQ